MQNKYKRVRLLLTVPKGDYCWNEATGAICEHLDNEGGVNSCEMRLGYGSQESTEEGIEKFSKCQQLTEIE